MKISRVGIDLAKNIFQVHGVDGSGGGIWKRQLRRSNWLRVLVERIEVDCEIGMEACGGAHHWARELKSRGYQVKLIPPQFVKPYVKGNKNDASDAAAICEAMGRAAALHARSWSWDEVSSEVLAFYEETAANRNGNSA